MPLLTFLIPVYNAGAYLVRCLDSIVSQVADSEVEIVIVDDGSKDNSLDIIRQYAGRHSYVRYVSRENHGIGYTRNELIDMAVGRFMWFVDADDYISADALATIIPLLRADRYDMLMFAFNWVSPGSTDVKHCSGEYATGIDMAAQGVFNNSLWTRVYRRSVITDNGIRFQNLQMGEDFDVIFRIIPHLGRCLCIDKPLYNYVVSPNSAITSSDMAHRRRASEDSMTCLEGNYAYIRQWPAEAQEALRKPLVFFLMGFLYALYVVPFSLKYKLSVMRRLSRMGAFPISPLPTNPRHRRFSQIINIPLLRTLSVVADAILLKIKRQR